MSTAFVLRLRDRKLLFRYCLLIFLWSFGLIAGIWLANTAADTTYPIIAEAVTTAPTLLGFFIICGVPIILCLVGIITDLFPINCIVIILESVCRGLCGFGIYLFCGSGAWLLRLLIMFSSTVCSVLVLWFSLRCCLYGKIKVRNDFWIIAIVMFLFIAVDQMLVSPFLIRLSIYI